MYLNKSILTYIFLMFMFHQANGEGAKQILPNSTDVAALMIDNASYGNFAVFGSTDDERLYLHIANPNTEQVFLGFSRAYSTMNGLFNSSSATDAYFRIKDPNGNIVYGPEIINSSTANISTWSEATTGPSNIYSGGYNNAFVFNPAGNPAGDYYIEFSTSSSSESNNDIFFPYFDITVATTGGSPTAIDGRLYSKRWALACPPLGVSDPTYGSFWRPFNGAFYVMDTDNGFVTYVDFAGSGFQPYAFNISFNSTGTANTGNPISDRKSVDGALSSQPEFPVFLNDPDQNVYPSGSFGTFTVNSNLPNIKGCGASSGYDISIEVTREGLVELLLDFDQASGAGNYDPGTADRLLILTVEELPGETAPYQRTISWDGLDGLGANVNTNVSLNAVFTYSQGEYHLPVYDAEYMITGFTPQSYRPTPSPSYNLRLYYDDTGISTSSGNGSADLNGCTPPCHTWTEYDYGNANTINTYWFAQQEAIPLSLNVLGCPPNADDEEVTTESGVAIDIDILDGDDDPNGTIDPTTVIIISQPSNGTISVDPVTGVVTYTSNFGFTGVDVFTYTVNDNDGETSNVATVRINVLPNIACIPERSVFDWATDFNGTGGSGAYNLQDVTFPYAKAIDGVTTTFTMDEPSPAGSVLQSFQVSDQFTGRPASMIQNGRAAVWTVDETANGGAPNHQATTLTIDFSQDVQGLQFAVLDLDDGDFDVDGVQFEFYLDGVQLTLDSVVFSKGSRVYRYADYTYVGEGTGGNASNTSTEGDIFVNLKTSMIVDQIKVIYGNYRGSSYNSSGNHFIGFSGMSWCKIVDLTENCTDGIDNNGNGLIDCDDPDCQNVGTSNTINNN